MADKLTLKQEQFVANYVGISNGNGTDAARRAGYKGDTAALASLAGENLRKPQILAAIDVYRAAIRSEGIANKQNRVDLLNDLAGRLERTIAARAADPTLHDVPGGKEGVLVRSTKFAKVYAATGSLGGDTLHPERPPESEALYPEKQIVLVEEYAVDTGMLAELRATLKQAAQEMGQWTEKSEVTGKDGVPLVTPHEHTPVDPASVVQVLDILARGGALPSVPSAQEVLSTGADGAADSVPADDEP